MRRRYMQRRSAIFDMNSLLILTAENLWTTLACSQAAEIQVTQEHACGVHLEQRRRDDTGSSVQCSASIIWCNM